MSKPNFYDHINVYDFSCELPGSKETVQFKPINTGQIKKLLTHENESNYVVQEQVLDDLISSSILSEGFNIDDQYIYDRLYLLIEIRKKTKGEVLEFQINCPECKSQSINRVDLNKLEKTEIDTEMNTMIELSNGIKVYLRHMKRIHQKEEIKAKFFPRKMTERQMAYMFQVCFHACAIEKIETPSGIDENIPFQDKIYFIESIPMQEMEKIKDKANQMAFGLKIEQKIKCVHCKYERTEEIPIQNNFFG